MKTPIALLMLFTLCLAGCSEKQTTPPAAQTSPNNAPATMFTNTSGSNPLTAPVDYLNALGRGKESAIKTVDTASLTQAIQMFNVQEGRYPKDLNELVEKQFINKVPPAPYGLKLDYDPTTGQVKVVKQ